MSKLTRQDIQKLARLARLSLTDEEIDSYSQDISEILNYIDQLSSVDTESIMPTYQVSGLVNVMRSDEIINYGTTPKELLNNAPSIEKDHFKVKRMIG